MKMLNIVTLMRLKILGSVIFKIKTKLANTK